MKLVDIYTLISWVRWVWFCIHEEEQHEILLSVNNRVLNRENSLKKFIMEPDALGRL